MRRSLALIAIDCLRNEKHTGLDDIDIDIDGNLFFYFFRRSCLSL